MHANRGYRFVFALALCLALQFEAPASITTTGSVAPNPATTTLSTTLYIGQAGTGTMLANAGSDVLSGNGYIGYSPGSNGTATIDGAGSTWTNNSSLYVGNLGTGALNVTSGGIVTTHTTYVGSELGTSGTVSIDGAGSILTMSNDLQLGYKGNGTLSVTNGGQLKNTGTTTSNIGSQYVATSTATIDGPGSKWINNSGLYIGSFGTASLTITNGASASSAVATVGLQSTVTVDGPGSSWSPLGLIVGTAASSSVTISNGAQLNVTGGVSIGPNVSSPLTITNSQATVGRLTLPANSLGYDMTLTNSSFSAIDLVGHLEEIGGVATISAHGLTTNGDLVFDQANGLQRQLVINGDPGQNITINLNVDGTGAIGAGYDAAGTLTIAGGRTVASTYGYLGAATNGTGTGTIDGAGTNWNITNDLDVGAFGQGSLSVTGGAHVADKQALIGSGNGISHTGAMVVSGIGTTWSNTLDLQVNQGSLQILSGAHVSDRNGTIGDFASAATAAVTVDGVGSSWANSGQLRIGDQSQGSLTVTNGGVVTSGSGYVSAFTALGTATIDGAGSTWTCNGDITVGTWGPSGTLQITNGGHVSSHAGEIGAEGGPGSGNVTVDGVGSSWTMTDALTVSFSSNLRILNGAQVSSTADTTVQSHMYGMAHILFDHGTLTTRTFYAGADELQGTGDVYAQGLVTDGDVVLSKVGGSWQPFKVTGQSSHDLTFHFTTSSLAVLGAGYKAAGSLTIADGLVVNSAIGEVGHLAGSNGVVHLSGAGTTWALSGYFDAGSNGTGTVDVTAGAKLSDYEGDIGVGAQAVGTVTINGAGSQWTNSSDMSVGLSGNGTLNVNSGGSVAALRTYVGNYSGSVGIANIDGAGSTWTIGNALYIGNTGTGALNVSNGGLVDVTGDLIVGAASGSKGTINLSGGTIRLHGGSLARASGTAVVNLTGGRLEGISTINLLAPFVQSGSTFAPGNGVGTTNIIAGYTLDSGKLEIDLLNSAQHDTVQVSGSVNLLGANGVADGILSVVLGAAPVIFSTIPVLTNDGTDAIVGTFANGSSLKAAYNGLLYTFNISYTASTGNDIGLTAQSVVGVLGDYNGDGVVNANDVVVWRKTLDTATLPYFGADGDGDGIVNDADYQVWRTNYGRTAPGGGSGSVNTAVPEPSTLARLTLAVVGFFVRMRRTA